MKKNNPGINFYPAYRESLRTKKSGARWLLAALPILLLLAAAGAVTVYIRFGNLQKEASLDSLFRQTEQLEGEYDEVQTLMAESESIAVLADELQADSLMAANMPTLDRNLFDQVKACAGETFSISDYRYDEAEGVLELDASAPSVNDMPVLVEALRDTGLFSSVYYVGYTSDTDGVYYCTVGCALMQQIGWGDE